MRYIVISTVLLAFSSLTWAADPGVTAKEVKIGAHTAESGFAAIYAAIPRAMTAYLDQVNIQGGVHGRKVSFVRIDTTGDQLRTVQATRKLVEQEKIFAMVGAMGPSHQAVYKYLVSKKVPDLFFTDGVREYGTPFQKMVFPWNMEWYSEGRTLGEYVAKKYKSKRACFLITDGAFGEEFLTGAKEALAKANVTVGMIERVERRAAQANSSVLALKRDKCEVVLSTTFSTLAPNAITYASSQDFNPMWALTAWNTHPKFFELVPPKTHDQIVSTGIWALSPEFGAKGWAEYEALVKKSDIGVSLNSVIGYTMGELFVEALKRAGKDLTRDGLIKAVESLNGWQCSLCLRPLEYSSNNHWPVRTPAIIVSKNSKWAPDTDINKVVR
ncbi:MAG: ABC transporter substrate-binding protein [Bdellovibrionales bacterium]